MECDCGAETVAYDDKCEDCQIREAMGDTVDRPDFTPDLKKCGKPLSRPNKRVKLYVMRWKRKGLVKIGVSSDVSNRLSQLQSEVGDKLDLVLAVPAPSRNVERFFHHEMRLEKANYNGEWYRATPRIERLISALRQGASTA